MASRVLPRSSPGQVFHLQMQGSQRRSQLVSSIRHEPALTLHAAPSRRSRSFVRRREAAPRRADFIGQRVERAHLAALTKQW